METNMVTPSDVAQAARAAGLKKGTVLLLHSGMKQLGRLEKGPDTIIDGLLEALGPQGTLVMPVFTWGNVPDLPPGYPLTQDRDPLPVWTGRVPARFAEYPGVKRSRHPLWSHAFLGPRSDELLAIDEKEIYGYGKGKIHYRIFELGGSTMFISAGFKSCSCAYVVFDTREMPHRQFIKERMGTSVEQYLKLSPQKQWELMYYQATMKIAQPTLAKLEAPLRSAGLLHEAPLGSGKVMHVTVPDLYRFMNEQYDKNPRFLFE
jgi:aminoglycoside 3-N-acetyltransferase